MKRWLINSQNEAPTSGAIFDDIQRFPSFAAERFVGSSWSQKISDRTLPELSNGIRNN